MRGKNKQKGFSLIEMSLVIAMMGVIASITFCETRHLVEKERAKQAVADIRTIYLGSVSYYDSYGTYGSVSMTELCASNLYVDKRICGASNGSATGPWNGDYVAIQGANTTQINITLNKVPPKYGGHIMRELLTDITINTGTSSYEEDSKRISASYYRSI